MQVSSPQMHSFNRHRGSGPRIKEDFPVVLGAPVSQAVALLQGFNVRFTRGTDRPLGNLEVRLETRIDELAPQRVIVKLTYGLRDWSWEWDDEYEGEIYFIVVGE